MIKSKWLGSKKVKEGIPYDPGIIQNFRLVEAKGNYMKPYFLLVNQSQVYGFTIFFKESQFIYDPP